MSQCVPSWDLDDNNNTNHVNRLNNLRSNSNFIPPDVSTLDYEVAELTWENGQLAMHGLGQPRVPIKPFASSATKYTWEKQSAGGTLESIVDQATSVPQIKLPFTISSNGNDLVPWFEHHRTPAAAAASGRRGATATVTMDAMVPCSNRSDNEPIVQQLDSVPRFGTCVIGCSTRVGSCCGAATSQDDIQAKRRTRVARVPAAAHELSSRDQSMSGSATFEKDSRHVTVDTCDKDFGLGFTSTSTGSPENTSSGKPYSKTTTTFDDHDSVCHSRIRTEAKKEEDKKKGNRKSSVSTRRSRAAAIHNQSERKRRDKINQRMKTLQKMVPNSSKTDKASMLDEVIEYLKQLQAQINMMRGINMSPMMLPLAMQQQLQMSMMAPMGMGMGMGPMGMGMGVMDMSTMGRHNIPGISPVLHPTAFMPLTSWDGSGGDRLSVPMTDPLSSFIAYQSQPMTMDAYSRMAALYQQLHQPPLSSSKS